MSRKPSAQEFLAKLNPTDAVEDVPLPRNEPARSLALGEEPASSQGSGAAVHTLPTPVAKARPSKKPSRAQLKHFGGYLDDETLEKIALLRIRLKKDNSELIKFAIEELHRKHNAKRAFGDV